MLEIPLGRVPEPVVSQLVKPHGQDVHEKAAEELDAGQSAGFPLALDCLASRQVVVFSTKAPWTYRAVAPMVGSSVTRSARETVDSHAR